MSEVKKIKPSLSKGTRDFLPSEVAKRNYIFDTIKSVFRKYGFEQIETPAIERLETLTGKYGEEGDKLLFKILNSGDYFSEIRNQKSEIRNLSSKEVTTLISEKGLRYDLTVPLARYVVQHQEELAFPFKRFHIGPVWRADRPQKGRYQEFYQCDADVIGSTSLLNEVELLKIYSVVFQKLELKKVWIKINNRKIIAGLAEIIGAGEKFQQIIIALDKLDKIEWSGVKEELTSIGLLNNQINQVEEFTRYVNYDMPSELTGLKKLLFHSEIGLQGVKELELIIKRCKSSGMDNVAFAPTLARGLNYYTGLIVEIEQNYFPIGSLGGGGRYDNLTEMFGGQNMSGVGISFGIERIYDVMEELNLFPETISKGVKVLFVPRDASAEEFTFQQTQTLRDAGIGAEIFLGNVKKQKQFNYAEQKNIAYIVEVGGDEMQSKKFRLRNTKARDTETDLSIEQIIAKVK